MPTPTPHPPHPRAAVWLWPSPSLAVSAEVERESPRFSRVFSDGVPLQSQRRGTDKKCRILVWEGARLGGQSTSSVDQCFSRVGVGVGVEGWGRPLSIPSFPLQRSLFQGLFHSLSFLRPVSPSLGATTPHRPPPPPTLF